MQNKELVLKYVSPCIGEKYQNFKDLPNYELFEKFNTPEEIRNYFFTKHNQKEINQKNLIHLVLPYRILQISDKEIKTELSINPTISFPNSQLKKTFSKNKFPFAELEGIIITHFLKPIDYLSQEEFNKYRNSFIL